MTTVFKFWRVLKRCFLFFTRAVENEFADPGGTFQDSAHKRHKDNVSS